MTGTPSVAARLTALCLDRSGSLRDDDYAAMAARGGLLVDLALARRLSQTDDSIDLDAAPTGWPPADSALTELALLDGRSLDWWLEHSRVHLDAFADALVTDGAWTRLPGRPLHRKPRYAVRGADVLDRDRALLAGLRPAADDADAAVLGIAVAAGLAGRHPAVPAADVLPAVAEPVAWVCQLITDFIGRVRIDGSAASAASQTALWSNLPY